MPSWIWGILFVVNAQQKHFWNIVPRLSDKSVSEESTDTRAVASLTECALTCSRLWSCRLFHYNNISGECALFDGKHYKGTSSAVGNKFFQAMPQNTGCIPGLDEWFPAVGRCIWIYPSKLDLHDANETCHMVSKRLTTIETEAQLEFVKKLMNMMEFFWIHTSVRRVGPLRYEWETGSPITIDWCQNQPFEDFPCVQLNTKLPSWCPNAGLDDHRCINLLNFFCE